MKKLTILCDMDSIIVDLTQKWLDLYNKDHGDNVTMEDIKTWHIGNHVKIGQKMDEYLYTEGFFLNVPAIPGAIDSLKMFIEKGHNVVIASAPSWPGNSATDKISWVRMHMPFVNKRNIMLGHQKHLLKGDLFIDDSPSNIKEYRKHWGATANIATIAYPYNQDCKDLVQVFAESYKTPLDAWKRISVFVDQLDGTHTCEWDKGHTEGDVTGAPLTYWTCKTCGRSSSS